VAKVEVGKGRSQIEDTPSGLRITIPAKKNYFLILFLAFWLVGWAFGEVTALAQVLNPESDAPKLFMLVWLGGWTVGGAFAIYAWLWNVKGKEIINISSLELQHIRSMPVFKRSKEYDLSAVSKLRAQAPGSSLFGAQNGMEFWGISGGSVVFDYGHSTHKFGVQLDEAEAIHIVNAINKRYKNL
jgi:hypothetical protein